MNELFKKVRKAFSEKRLYPAIKSNLRPYLYGARFLFHDAGRDSISLHCPDYAQPNENDSEMVERIYRCYQKMKKDQKNASTLYQPSSLWQQQLNESYSLLGSGDINEFHYFLENFGCWKKYHGVAPNMIMNKNRSFYLGRKFLKNIIFHNQLKFWRWFYNDRKVVRDLAYPMHGNQSGAFIEGEFVGVGSFWNEIYGSILEGLVDDVEKPVIAELGAGCGIFAYFTLRNLKGSCFIDFDLPETVCLAAYYLMKEWPNKRALLYGEEEFSSASSMNYELIFMPAFEIEKLEEKSVDLFINKTSLGEMTRNAASNYVDKIVKSTEYFFHMNHEIFANFYSDGEAGLLGHEYPVPSEDFKMLFRYPDVGHMLYRGGVDYYMDIFVYLYQCKTRKNRTLRQQEITATSV